MKTTENQIIGELIAELDQLGMPNLSIDVDDTGTHRFVSVTVDCRDNKTQCGGTGATMIEALEATVNCVRELAGLPSLEDEVASLLEADAKHGKALVVTGPDACCAHCGSERSLHVVRHFTFLVDWKTGDAWMPWENKADAEINVKPGEIGTCPDCGKSYTFQPS